jgi:hypothetical protein
MKRKLIMQFYSLTAGSNTGRPYFHWQIIKEIMSSIKLINDEGSEN